MSVVVVENRLLDRCLLMVLAQFLGLGVVVIIVRLREPREWCGVVAAGGSEVEVQVVHN